MQSAIFVKLEYMTYEILHQQIGTFMFASVFSTSILV